MAANADGAMGAGTSVLAHRRADQVAIASEAGKQIVHKGRRHVQLAGKGSDRPVLPIRSD